MHKPVVAITSPNPETPETEFLSDTDDGQSQIEMVPDKLSLGLQYLKQPKPQNVYQLQPILKKFSFRSLTELNRMVNLLEPRTIKNLHTPFKTYKAFTIKTKSFTKRLTTVLRLLGRATKTVKRIFTSKFVKLQRPELAMFSPNIKSMRKRKTSQHFAGLALKSSFR